jgi:hypothetical protein
MTDNIKSLLPIAGLTLLFITGSALLGWAWYLISQL